MAYTDKLRPRESRLRTVHYWRPGRFLYLDGEPLCDKELHGPQYVPSKNQDNWKICPVCLKRFNKLKADEAKKENAPATHLTLLEDSPSP